MSETEIEPKTEFIRKPNLSESRMFRGSEVWIEPRHYNREVTTFGGSRDVVIYNNANTNQNSYSDLGYAYQPPAGISMALHKPCRCLLVVTTSHQQKLKFLTQ